VVFSSTLIRTVPVHPAATVTYTQDWDGFQVAGADVRRVEPRNAPTVINSIFSRLQFWDGRAKEVFNGVNINGAGDTTALVIKATNPTSLAQVSVAIPNSSIASLVTGPPQSVFEMSAAGRNLHQIGSKFFDRILKKIRMLRPLNLQTVHPLDSVLGGVYSRSPKTGLAIASYDSMIQAAFNRVWWQSTMLISVAADGTPTWVPANSVRTVADNQFTLMEYNFGLFAGLAIEKYLSTLVADQTPFDKYQGGDTTALTADQIAGLGIFVKATTPGNNGGGNCNTCHTIPEFTRGSVRRTAGTNSTDNGDPLINGGANGFFTNYAVAAVNDQGAPQTPTPAVISSRFRAPTLRNIELTAPYFHNGGAATLEQVVDFYNRGRGDGVGASNSPTRAAVAAALGLTVTQKAQLVAFLKSLTDERVRKEQAPFDHPSMKIPNGQQGTEFSVVSQNLPDWPIAYDLFSNIPAVGAAGVTTTQSKFFDNLAKP
jgi:cytochrome c peroxidase